MTEDEQQKLHSEVQLLRQRLRDILELSDGMQLARHDACRDHLHAIARLARPVNPA